MLQKLSGPSVLRKGRFGGPFSMMTAPAMGVVMAVLTADVGFLLVTPDNGRNTFRYRW